MISHDVKKVLHFWFVETKPAQRWKKNRLFDALIKKKFAKIHQSVAAGETWQWRKTPHGALAEIIVLDQFSRNMFRNKAESFSFDAHALALAQTAVASGKDQKVSKARRLYFYMPYMHSESKVVHKEALRLFEKLGDAKYEKLHKRIIDRFGRYPHRNDIVGRKTTVAEKKFLKEDRMSSF